MPAAKPTKQDEATPAVRLGRGRRPLQRRLRDAKDALYRQHILEVAETIFAQHGFAATKMQTIAAKAIPAGPRRLPAPAIAGGVCVVPQRGLADRR